MKKILDFFKRFALDILKRVVIAYVAIAWIYDYAPIVTVGLILFFVIPRWYYRFLLNLCGGSGYALKANKNGEPTVDRTSIKGSGDYF